MEKFGWGDRLLKSNGGVLMARVLCNNLWPDCEGPPKQAPPVGYRDPSFLGVKKKGARQIKATLGITALSRQRSFFTRRRGLRPRCWIAGPWGAAAPKGWPVRPKKPYMI